MASYFVTMPKRITDTLSSGMVILRLNIVSSIRVVIVLFQNQFLFLGIYLKYILKDKRHPSTDG